MAIQRTIPENVKLPCLHYSFESRIIEDGGIIVVPGTGTSVKGIQVSAPVAHLLEEWSITRANKLPDAPALNDANGLLLLKKTLHEPTVKPDPTGQGNVYTISGSYLYVIERQ